MVSETPLPIGKVVKAHGLKGHLKVIPYGETLFSLSAGEKITAYLSDGTSLSLTVVEVRPHQKAFLFLSGEISTVEEARRLAGAELCVHPSRLPPTVEDEFYWFQLIGLEVVSTDGRVLGTIEEIIETGSNDVYVVRLANEEILVPAIQQVVREVDLQKRQMTVDLPETY
ncbi:MAG: 16S rRNA processing protein RimM [Deltaproteobacteria bacterium]|nr:MAG: 16S rRNA processing protein RimM [Deltaproteobacteria bacterium]